jgi:malate dehydrogenase (oxaloacetate-decarboxylating)
VKDYQAEFAKTPEFLANWENPTDFSLENVVKEVRPTILVGVSGQASIFTEEMVKYMCSYTEHPIILPLSNPTAKCEALPKDLIEWTDAKAIIATGSPFDPVEYKGDLHTVAQCNNAYIFPGLGLGVVSVKARRITNGMFMAASKALADISPCHQLKGADLLPPLTNIHEVSKKIAVEVAKVAIKEGLALPIPEETLPDLVESNFWLPEYREYKRTSP